LVRRRRVSSFRIFLFLSFLFTPGFRLGVPAVYLVPFFLEVALNFEKLCFSSLLLGEEALPICCLLFFCCLHLTPTNRVHEPFLSPPIFSDFFSQGRHGRGVQVLLVELLFLNFVTGSFFFFSWFCILSVLRLWVLWLLVRLRFSFPVLCPRYGEGFSFPRLRFFPPLIYLFFSTSVFFCLNSFCLLTLFWRGFFDDALGCSCGFFPFPFSVPSVFPPPDVSGSPQDPPEPAPPSFFFCSFSSLRRSDGRPFNCAFFHLFLCFSFFFSLFSVPSTPV